MVVFLVVFYLIIVFALPRFFFLYSFSSLFFNTCKVSIILETRTRLSIYILITLIPSSFYRIIIIRMLFSCLKSMLL